MGACDVKILSARRPRALLVVLSTVALLATAVPAAAASSLQPSGEPAPAGGAVYAEDRIIVKFRSETTARTTVGRLGPAVTALRDEGPGDAGVNVLEVDPAERDAVLAQLRSSAAVEYAELDPAMHVFRTPNDRFWDQQWGSRRVHAPQAWDLEVGVSDTIVAVLDTGVVPRHPDLERVLMRGHDFVNRDPHPHDDDIFGHGTQVTGVIAARGNNGRGVAGYCWRCRVLPVKVLDELGGGFASDAARGIRYAVDRGADVINMSFGGPRGSRVLREAILYARRRGVVLVAAAGNSNSRDRNYPVAYAGVLAVAGSNKQDGRYRHPRNRGIGSNFGPWVDLAAPWFNATTGPDNGYYDFGGTSSAAPVVSGIAALLKSLTPGIGASNVRALLFRSAKSGGVGYVTHGRVEADRPLIWRLGGVPLVGDWNGDGRDTPGWFKRGVFYLTNRHGPRRSFRAFRFGQPGDTPLVGDWDGDGTDTIGVRRGRTWYLRNRNTTGPATHTFDYARVTDTPLAGDWDGDGTDTIGVRRGGAWYLRDALGAGPRDHELRFGRRGDVPVVGDWDNDGRDTVGIRRQQTLYLKNTLVGRRADVRFALGTAAATPVSGDFDGDGRDTVGVRVGYRWSLRNANSAGRPNLLFWYGG